MNEMGTIVNVIVCTCIYLLSVYFIKLFVNIFKQMADNLISFLWISKVSL